MVFTLYTHGVKPLKSLKNRGTSPTSDEDKRARHKEAQRIYYQERGAFIAYLRRIERKLNMDKHTLKHIESVEALEAFSKQYIKDKVGIDINDNATAYIVHILKNDKQTA